MTSSYSRSPRILKGALIELTEPFLGPIPNVIPFQYNPEKMTRTLTPWTPPQSESGDAAGAADPLAQPHDPQESFTLALELDATDALENPDSNPVAVVAGVADRIAALEKLMFPVEGGLLGGLGSALGSLVGLEVVPRRTAPVVLFVWGPGRILPVRVTSFRVEETAYSTTLYPIMATVHVGLRVLTPAHFERPGRTLTLAESLAVTSYRFTHAQKEVLARAGLATNLDSILGILPF